MSNGRPGRPCRIPPSRPRFARARRPVQECAPAVHRLRWCGLGLGPTNPELITRAQEPSGFRWRRLSRRLLLLVPAFSLPRAPAVLALDLLRSAEYSPTTRRSPASRRTLVRIACAASVACFQAPLDCRRTTTRPVSCYALFQWWLLLSQHPGCRCRRTSFPTEHALRDLSRRSGLFPSRRRSLAPAVSLPWRGRPAFVVWLGVVSSRPRTHPGPYLRPPVVPRASPGTHEAAPLCISGRTSYLLVRLAFHPYPQVIPMLCKARGFGPSRRVTAAAPCPWVAHQVSGQRRPTMRPLRTRLRCGSGADAP